MKDLNRQIQKIGSYSSLQSTIIEVFLYSVFSLLVVWSTDRNNQSVNIFRILVAVLLPAAVMVIQKLCVEVLQLRKRIERLESGSSTPTS